MNTLVELEISVRRERDEPGVRYLGRYMARVRMRLAGYREERRRAEGEIGREMERLRRVVGEGSGVAKMQAEEVRRVMGRGVECLR